MVATATGVVVCQLHFTGLSTLLVSCDSAIVLLLYCAPSLLCCFAIVLLRYCAASLLCSSLLCFFSFTFTFTFTFTFAFSSSFSFSFFC